MNCPTCAHGEHRVYRTDVQAGAVRRSRECLRCGNRWRTLEVPEKQARRFADLAEAWRAMGRIVGEE